MAGVKGKITTATGGKQRSVYLSNKFGLWPEGNELHITMISGKQELHTSINDKDGLLYEVMMMLYHYGKAS